LYILRFCRHCQFDFSVLVGLFFRCRCLFTIGGNGLGLCEVGAFKAQMFNLAQMFIRITNA
ncbi:MAG: hypothetical protein ACO1G4_07725, partial [Bacteroidota bacterium]